MDQDDHSELFTGLAVCRARFFFLFFSCLLFFALHYYDVNSRNMLARL